MTNFDLYLKRGLFICAALALLSVPYLAWKLGKAADSVTATAAAAQKPIARADDLLSTINTLDFGQK